MEHRAKAPLAELPNDGVARNLYAPGQRPVIAFRRRHTRHICKSFARTLLSWFAERVSSVERSCMCMCMCMG